MQRIYDIAGDEAISGYTHGAYIQSICTELFQTCHDFALGVRVDIFPMVQPPFEDEGGAQQVNFDNENIYQQNMEEPAHQALEPNLWSEWDAPRTSIYAGYYGGHAYGSSSSQFMGYDQGTSSTADPGQVTQELSHQQTETAQQHIELPEQQNERARRSPNFFQLLSGGLLTRRSKCSRHPSRSSHDS